MLRSPANGWSAEHGLLREGRELLDQKDTVEWWTFAGGAANTLLAPTMLPPALPFETASGGGTLMDDRACRMRTPLASSAARTELSKFEPCLPNEQLAELEMRGCSTCAAPQLRRRGRESMTRGHSCVFGNGASG